MIYALELARGIGGRIVDGTTLPGNTWTKLVFASAPTGSTGTHRSGAWISCDPQRLTAGALLYILPVQRGSILAGGQPCGATNIPLTPGSAMMAINGGGSEFFAFAKSIEIWAWPSVAGAVVSGFEVIA